MNITKTVARVFGKGDSNGAPAPDALTLMRTDHREVEALFAEALGDAPAAKRRAAVAKILEALTIHAQMEEALFYPALRKAGGAEERDSVLEAAEEHGVVKDLIAKIQGLRGRDETLEAKVTVLKELVQHHVKEEESTIFNEAKKVLGDERLTALGAEMQRFKQRAKRNGKTTGKQAAEQGTPSAAGPRKTRTAARGTKKTGAKKAAKRNVSTRKRA